MLRSCVLTIVLSLASMDMQASVLTTTVAWDGQGEVGTFGEGSTDTYGQTFTAPAGGSVLQCFGLYIDDRLNPDVVTFAAYVMEWADADGIEQAARAVGPVLYESNPLSTTNNGGQDGFEHFTFQTGDVNLDPGKKYVFFVSSSNLWDGIHGGGKVGAVYASTYAGGEFVYQSTGNTFSAITNGAGWNVDPTRDLAFSAEISPVPIPAAAWLLGGALGLTGLMRRKTGSYHPIG